MQESCCLFPILWQSVTGNCIFVLHLPLMKGRLRGIFTWFAILCMVLAGSFQAVSQGKSLAGGRRDTSPMAVRSGTPANSSGRRTDSSGTDSVLLLHMAALQSMPGSLPLSFVPDSSMNYQQRLSFLLAHNRYFSASHDLVPGIIHIRKAASQDALFGTVILLFFLLAIIRFSFSKYFHDLFTAFLNPTLSQRQLKDQLSQTPLPSLLLNIFFTISTGTFIFLILKHSHYFEVSNPVFLIPIFILLIALVYLGKYVFLQLSTWLFGFEELLNNYIFTLFMINKVIGILLLPFILLIAFAPSDWAVTSINCSLILISFLLIYRYIRAYGLVRHHISFSKFHFFLYLCGFEIAPVLLLGKLVLIWLNGA